MNEFRAFAAPVCAGWHAMIRLPADAAARPIMADGGRPKVFPTELEAHKEATRHLERYVNGNMRRDGATLGEMDPDVERVFANFAKQRGRDRRIPVEVRR